MEVSLSFLICELLQVHGFCHDRGIQICAGSLWAAGASSGVRAGNWPLGI